ncbi:ECF transporter S component [Dehalococcoidia bacterium]|nr:ECF transporter S component [Dehalococcoidia bacterium]
MRTGKFFARFSMFDLVIIALMAALGIAAKPVIVPLVRIITGPLLIPGGALAGGFYMMWLIIPAGLVGKAGTAALVAIVQAILVMATGIWGTHGIASLATYILPGVAVDLVFLFARRRKYNFGHYFLAGMAANVTGTFLVMVVFFKLPLIPLLFALSCGALSGGLGGLIAYNVVKRFQKFKAAGLETGG